MELSCTFCGTQEETIYYRFVDCIHTNMFLEEVGNYIGNNIINIKLLDKEIILGYPNDSVSTIISMIVSLLHSCFFMYY